MGASHGADHGPHHRRQLGRRPQLDLRAAAGLSTAAPGRMAKGLVALRPAGPLMRCALYARFSNDERQNRLSAEDQLVVCRRHADARGWEVVAEYRDEGISGAA